MGEGVNEEFSPVPELPEGIREAAQRGILIPFVGAGASCIAGCPGWSDLANRALEHFVEHGKFSYGQLEQIRHLNPRVRLSIARGLQEQHGIRIDFDKLLHRSGNMEKEKGRQLY